MATVNEKMTAIADNIREYAHLDNKLTLDGMASGIALVHEQAYADGHAEGLAYGEERGFAAGEAKHTSRYMTALVTGDGTKNISFACPFEPDYIAVKYHGADASSAAAAVTCMVFDRRSFALHGGYYIVRLTGKNYIGTVGSATGGAYFSWENGACTVTSPVGSALYIDGCQYICVAVKYTDKSDRELLEEEISRLSDTGGELYYSEQRVTEVMTEEEWQEIIAAKENWTFTLG